MWVEMSAKAQIPHFISGETEAQKGGSQLSGRQLLLKKTFFSASVPNPTSTVQEAQLRHQSLPSSGEVFPQVSHHRASWNSVLLYAYTDSGMRWDKPLPGVRVLGSSFVV